MGANEILRVARLLPRHPRRFSGELAVRGETALERHLYPAPRYQTVTVTEGIAGLEEALDANISPYLQDRALHETLERIERKLARLPVNSPLPLVHLSDLSLGRLLYGLCRAIQPRIVVETGVAYGRSSALMLQALESNGNGVLHSIDLTPASQADLVGSLVPAELNERWRFHRGATKQVLPGLLTEAGEVDLFVHDSRHTYRNILRELRTARPHLARPGIVVADDIQRNSAWATWVSESSPEWEVVLEQDDKGALAGVAVL